MHYLLMLYAKEDGWNALSESDQKQGVAAYATYTEALQKAGVLAGSNRLQPDILGDHGARRRSPRCMALQRDSPHCPTRPPIRASATTSRTGPRALTCSQEPVRSMQPGTPMHSRSVSNATTRCGISCSRGSCGWCVEAGGIRRVRAWPEAEGACAEVRPRAAMRGVQKTPR